MQTGNFLLPLVLLNFARAELNHNEPCSAEPSKSCNFDKGLICGNHPNGSAVCRCVDEAQMEYNGKEDSCLVFVNGKRNWIHPSQPEHHIDLPCRDPHVYDADYEDSHCGCLHDFSPEQDEVISADNRCLPSASWEYCDSTLPCHPGTGMICSRGRCNCPHPLNQNMVGDHIRKCTSIPELANGCKNASDCVPNAECGADNICHCKAGFVIGQNLHWDVVGCFVDHGGKCDDDELHHGELQCNHAAYLDCVEGKCACLGEPDLVYDNNFHQCTSPEGHVCSLNHGYTNPDHDNVVCSSGLECQPIAPGKYLHFGKCVKK